MKRTILVLLLMVFTTAQAAVHIELDSGSRTSLSLTVFNSNLAIIEDHRQLVLPKGDIELEFTDVAATIESSTVTLRSAAAKGFVANQQNYRFDLLNRRSLLERFIGKKVKYSRFLLEEDNYEKVLREGILLSIEPEIVRFGDIIEIQPGGTISLPYIPDDLITTPTLVFKGTNQVKGDQNLDVRYHTGGVGWEADYSLTLDDKTASLNGWVTIRNNSGTNFEVDDLRLVAGDVNRAPVRHMQRESKLMAMADSNGSANPVDVGEYHAYDFPGRVDLLKNDMIQLRLITSKGIKYKKLLRLVSGVARYGNQPTQELSPSAFVVFSNSRKNDLDTPLPAGTIRVYEAAKRYGDTFVGESRIQHNSAGSEVEIEIGRAFDVKASRTQTDFRRLGDRSSEVSYRIELRNAKKEKVTVSVEESLGVGWRLVEQSRKGKKRDANTYVFEVEVPAKGSAAVEYTAQFVW